MNQSPIRIDYQDLVNIEHSDEVQDLFELGLGLKGFGAIIVTKIPNFEDIRRKVLCNMYKLTHEPQNVLDTLVQPNPSSLYEVGWHVKKMNSAFGKSSNRFVSFFSRYPIETVVFPDSPDFEAENLNIWPTTVPDFKKDLTALNEKLVPPLVGLLKYIDKYLEKNITNYPKNKFVRSFSSNYSNANRLISYLPLEQFSLNKEDAHNWDNWHTDFGLLATATYPLYFDRNGDIYDLAESCFSLRDRLGHEHKMSFYPDEFIITSSDAMFIESAGYLPATPHTVKIKKGMPRDIYRCQSVSFFEPHLNYVMDIPSQESFQQIIDRDPTKYDHRGIDHFTPGCLYKTFIDELLEFLYK